MNADNHIMAFLQSLGWPELLVIGIIALLIFGKRLPEVGRSLGKSFVEFKKGLKETGDEINQIKSEADQIASDTHEQHKPLSTNSKQNADFNHPQ